MWRLPQLKAVNVSLAREALQAHGVNVKELEDELVDVESTNPERFHIGTPGPPGIRQPAREQPERPNPQAQPAERVHGEGAWQATRDREGPARGLYSY